MAGPLPKDLEKRIAGTAKRSEVRSVGVLGFILGTAVGYGLASVFQSVQSRSFFFGLGAVMIAALWLYVARRRKNKK